MGERLAWLVLAVQQAAADGYPFGKGGKNANEGLYQRRSQLPSCIGTLGAVELGRILSLGLEAKQIVPCAAKGEKAAKWLDVPTGSFATNDTGEEIAKGAWRVPDWNRWAYDPGQGVCVTRAALAAPAETLPLGFHPNASAT